MKKKKNKCIEGHNHVFQIIRGSGIQTNIPSWKCILCKQIVKST